MISKAILVATLLSFVPIRDYERPVRIPIPRSEKVANVIATAALETDDPISSAIALDVIGAHESGYRDHLVGDHGQSCGAWQTPCVRTPGFIRCDYFDPSETECHWGWKFQGKPTTALEQARLALSIWKTAQENCAEHPMWMYASGTCTRSRTADLYEIDIAFETSSSTEQLASQ